MRGLPVSEPRKKLLTRRALLCVIPLCMAWCSIEIWRAHDVAAMHMEEAVKALRAHGLSENERKVAAAAIGIRALEAVRQLEVLSHGEGRAAVEARAAIARIHEALR